MKNNKRLNPKILNWNILLTMGTLAIVLVVFYLSNAEPSWTFNWKEIRPEIRDTVKLIERYGSVTSGVVGPGGRTPQQWHRRIWLMRKANETELMKLLEYPNGAVKATAYQGALIRSFGDEFELIKQALNDTITFFNYQSGCLGDTKMVGEYLLEDIIQFSDKMPPVASGKIERYNLSEEEVVILKDLYHERVAKKEEYFRNVYD